jgi:hypothetical protein
MTSSLRTRIIVLVAVVFLAVPVSGIAYAYWSGAASGAGSGATGTLAAISLTPGTAAATLAPGGQTAVVLSISNSNDTAVKVGSLSLNSAQGTGGFAVDAGHAACGVAALTFTTQTNAGAGWTVPARVGAVNGTLAVTLSNALAMASSAASACQGATFTVYLVAGS